MSRGRGVQSIDGNTGKSTESKLLLGIRTLETATRTHKAKRKLRTSRVLDLGVFTGLLVEILLLFI
jgi:hypothetical protein